MHCDRWSVYSVVQGSEVAEMPSWMDNLYKKFSSSACSFNIQLFIAKLILNTDEVKVVHTPVQFVLMITYLAMATADKVSGFVCLCF